MRRFPTAYFIGVILFTALAIIADGQTHGGFSLQEWLQVGFCILIWPITVLYVLIVTTFLQ